MTNAKFVELLKEAVNKKFGYVWGARGQLYTKELAQSWQKDEDRGVPSTHWDLDTYYIKDCSKWFGHQVVDCSGLIWYCLSQEKKNLIRYNALGFFNTCTNVGKISAMPEIEGIILYRKGHIAVYIGNDKLIEAKGTNYGVVISNFNPEDWQYWGFLGGIKYPTKDTVITLRKGDRNTGVYLLQIVLSDIGYSILIDGIFGADTLSCVKRFQKSRNLDIDGIVGTCTWYELIQRRIEKNGKG